MESKVKIPEYAKVKVYWDDKPENYSRANKLKVRNYFATEYGLDKNNINVIYRPVKIGKNGETIEITGAGLDNVMDKNYQTQLMKEWFTREGKTVDFNRILALDKKVNGSLDGDFENLNHRSWTLKWMYIDNFLCFGDDNFVSFGNLTGLNIVNSEPPNQGGKTTFSVDSIKFLLYGKTTKTEKNDQIFNAFRDKNTLVVRGLLDIEGEDIIIERKLSRSAKKSGGYTVTNKVHYYRILPDGEEEGMNEEDAKQTTSLIQKTIGTEKDFDVTILATAGTLENLVEAKSTESGRLLTKFIGLEVIENKEVIAKKMNSEFNKTKKGNIYNAVELLTENETNKSSLIEHRNSKKALEVKLEVSVGHLENLEKKKDKLLSSKLNVDVEISHLNPETLELEIDKITTSGLSYKEKITTLTDDIKELSKVTYNEDEYHILNKEYTDTSIEIGKLTNEIQGIGILIDNLENSEICQGCKRPLEDVDNSKQISDNKELKESKANKVITNNKSIEEINEKLAKIKVNRELVDKRNRLELDKDKCEVEIGALRNKITSKKLDLEKYKANEEAIKININIDADISAVKTDIIVETRIKDDIGRQQFTLENLISKANDSIETNEVILTQLKAEEEIEKVFKVYLEMIGKKGISKLVLRSVLPIINSELQRLLDDACDFEVELSMTDKNDVEYLIIKNNVSKLLKSGSGLELTIASIALRCVLGKISHLPMPNFITFDEVLGKVATINYEKVKPIFEKVKNMYDIVFLITHNDLVKDWGDKVITVKKKDDVSTINIK